MRPFLTLILAVLPLCADIIDVRLATPGVAALQFDTSYSGTLTAALGPAATDADKTLYYAPLAEGYRFLIAGININTMQPGTLLDITTDGSPFALSNVIACDPYANPMPATLTTGGELPSSATLLDAPTAEVPEPASLVLLAGAVLMMLACARKRGGALVSARPRRLHHGLPDAEI